MVKIAAHKTILSSASTVFKQLLLMNESTTNHQILFLKGIKYEDLESLLQFIYLGESKVYESRIEWFVSASNDLGITKLNYENIDRITDPLAMDTVIATKEENDTKYTVVNNPTDPLVMDTVIATKEENDAKYTVNDTTKLGTKMYPIVQTKIPCQECNATFSSSSSMSRHYTVTHAGVKIPCSYCRKEFTQRSNLDRHVKSIHLGIKFPCSICERSFTQKGELDSHSKHDH